MARYREPFPTKGGEGLIRNAEAEDAAKLFEFMRYVDRETAFLAREPGEFEASYTLEQETSLLGGWAESATKLFLVVETPEGELAATCGCNFDNSRRRSRHRAEIAISVRQDFWRMGLGRRLLQTQFDWCRQNDVEKLCLTVYTDNLPAIGLYLGLGFEVEGTLRREAKMPDGTYRDLYTMAKFL